MLFSYSLVKRLFYVFSKKRRGAGGGNSENNLQASEPTGDGISLEVEIGERFNTVSLTFTGSSIHRRIEMPVQSLYHLLSDAFSYPKFDRLQTDAK